ncbi:Sorting nexin MVP1 [Balamuthia mandrillaris]
MADKGKIDLYSMLPSGWESGGRPANPLPEVQAAPAATSMAVPQPMHLFAPQDQDPVEEEEEEEGIENGDFRTSASMMKNERPTEPKLVKNEPQDAKEEEEDEEVEEALFQITLGEYVKHKTFVAYQIHVKTRLLSFAKTEFKTERRYKDFLWLHDRLCANFKGRIVPPLPEKTLIQGKFDVQFLEKRRRELTQFLRQVCTHPEFARSTDLQIFLEFSAEELDQQKGKQGSAMAQNSKKVLALVAKKVSAREVDEWFTQKLNALLAYDALLELLIKQATEYTVQKKNIVQQQYLLSEALREMGRQSAIINSKTLCDDMLKLSEVMEQVRLFTQTSTTEEEVRFEEVLVDHQRMIGAAKAAFNDRLSALSEYQNLQKQLESKKERVEKMRGSHKVSSVEAEYFELKGKVEIAESEFNSLSAIVRTEMIRFEKSRVPQIRKALRDFATANLHCTVQTLDQWKQMIDQVYS